MAEKGRKRTDIIFDLWLLLAGTAIILLSIRIVPAAYFGKIKDFGLVCLALLDMLGVLMILTGRSDWAGMNGRKKKGRAQAVRFLLSFLIGTAMYTAYCIADRDSCFWGTEIRDALIAGAAVCISFFFGRKKE